MTSPLILLCDHRGAGLENRAALLAARGYRVEVTQTLRRSVDRIESDPPALIVLDPLNPGGVVELETIDRARSGEPPIPLLLVVDPEGSLDALASARHLEGGAWDVVWRDAGVEELQLRIERLESVGALLDEMGALRHRASHDDRTDLLRPKAFEARLSEHFSAAERHRFELALVLIDLDRFGAINKLHDHTVGDILITQVGEVIRRALRAEDVAGRLGGDEFAVLLPYTKKIDAARVVDRLREEISKLSGRPGGATEDVTVSASLGFETYDGTDLESARELRQHAEKALRAAKVEGGNRGMYYRRLARERSKESEGQ